MRGKVIISTSNSFRHRITPAYAGKREIANDYQLGNEDHPRLCGEKSFFLIFLWSVQGSPPPMRGKAETFAVTDLLIGITPAYAGKSCLSYEIRSTS